MRPYSRGEFNRALIVNALTSPFNVLLLAAILIAGLLLDLFLPLLIVGVVVYGLAAARTYLDEDEATRALERERARRRKTLDEGRVDPRTLAEPIGRLLMAALQREQRIRDAIDRAELPYTEVSAEVDALVTLMEHSASRAQLLYEALAESPPNRVRQRLVQLEGSGKTELIDALQHQHAVQRKMRAQRQRFYDEMERMVVELDTIRGSLVSVSASTDTANQQRIAADVRSLRDELGTLADGMSEAFGETSDQP